MRSGDFGGFFRGFSKSPVTSRGLLYSIYMEFRGQKIVKQPIGGGMLTSHVRSCCSLNHDCWILLILLMFQILLL